MVRTTCDPRALRVAQELHRTEQPEVTILFGSRARGDYQDGQSDIDIMLVQENLPSKEQKSNACRTAQEATLSLYGQTTQVQIVWKTSDEFDRMRRTVNHLVANALRDGVIMPRDSEEYVSRYGSDYNQEENEPAVTEQ